MHAVDDSWLYATTYFVGNWKKTENNREITKEIIETEYSKYEWSTPHAQWDFDTKTYNERAEIATGAAEATKTKNIYDLAGNMWEWTTETGKHNGTSTTYAVHRAGGLDVEGSTYPVCTRFSAYSSNDTYNVNIGFRVVLYVK